MQWLKDKTIENSFAAVFAIALSKMRFSLKLDFLLKKVEISEGTLLITIPNTLYTLYRNVSIF